MGYHVVDPQGLPPAEDYPCDRRSVTEATDLASLAAAVYELAPGEQLPRFYHYHEQREELFYVLAGTLAVETPDGEYEVPEGSVFVAEPDSPHRAFNPEAAGRSVRVFGVGAPRYDVGRAYAPETDARPDESDASESGR
jgi:quercetin dioxygenase-like cupin family protein